MIDFQTTPYVSGVAFASTAKHHWWGLLYKRPHDERWYVASRLRSWSVVMAKGRKAKFLDFIAESDETEKIARKILEMTPVQVFGIVGMFIPMAADGLKALEMLREMPGFHHDDLPPEEPAT